MKFSFVTTLNDQTVLLHIQQKQFMIIVVNDEMRE